MKRHLYWEIIFSFFTVIVISMSLMAVFISSSAKNSYSNFLLTSDREMAEQLVSALDYADVSLKEAIEILRAERFFFLGSNMMRGHSASQNFRRGGMMHILLLDKNGKVLLNTYPELGDNIPDSELGVPLYIHGELVAKIFAGRMADPAMSKTQRLFISQINSAIMVSLLIGLLISFLTAVYLTRRISGPILKLSIAVSSVAKGDFSVRVSIKHKNEIGTLAGDFNKMAAALQKSYEFQKNMIADTAHELRTPVALIQSRLEMMLEGIYDIKRSELEQMYGDSTQLAKLIKDLQSLHDSESGVIHYAMKRLHMDDLVDQSISSFEAAAAGKNVKLRVYKDMLLPEVYGDQSRLLQVLHNVIENALEYTEKHTEVVINVKREENNIKIVIKDSGIGILKNERGNIFQRFYRIDNSRNRDSGGSGLGLAICRQIITAHHGKIYVDNTNIDRGTAFIIKLPII